MKHLMPEGLEGPLPLPAGGGAWYGDPALKQFASEMLEDAILRGELGGSGFQKLYDRRTATKRGCFWEVLTWTAGDEATAEALRLYNMPHAFIHTVYRIFDRLKEDEAAQVAFCRQVVAETVPGTDLELVAKGTTFAEEPLLLFDALRDHAPPPAYRQMLRMLATA